MSPDEIARMLDRLADLIEDEAEGVSMLGGLPAMKRIVQAIRKLAEEMSQ